MTTPLTVRVRDAVPTDVDVITEFNARLARESEARELDPRILRSGVAAVLSDLGRGRYFVAMVGAEVAGQLMITTEWSDWRNGWFWWIQSVYVAERFRGHGVYRTLHRHVESTARAAGNVIGLRLYVEEENHRARTTYEHQAMHKTGYLLYETDWSGAIRSTGGAPTA